VAATWGKLEILQKACNSAKEELKTEEVYNKLLLGTDNEGRTMWHMVTEKGDLKILQKVWDWAKKLTTGEKNDKFLLGTENKGRMVGRLAAEELDLYSLQ